MAEATAFGKFGRYIVMFSESFRRRVCLVAETLASARISSLFVEVSGVVCASTVCTLEKVLVCWPLAPRGFV